MPDTPKTREELVNVLAFAIRLDMPSGMAAVRYSEFILDAFQAAGLAVVPIDAPDNMIDEMAAILAGVASGDFARKLAESLYDTVAAGNLLGDRT